MSESWHGWGAYAASQGTRKTVAFIVVHELVLEHSELKLIVIHLGDDARQPALDELRGLLGEASRPHKVLGGTASHPNASTTWWQLLYSHG